MTTATDTPDARAVYDLAMRLSPEERDRLIGWLADADPPVPPPPVPDWAADPGTFRAELQRIHDAVRDGTMPTYTIEETMAYLRKAQAERDRA